jgi:hypothetical protein
MVILAVEIKKKPVDVGPGERRRKESRHCTGLPVGL